VLKTLNRTTKVCMVLTCGSSAGVMVLPLYEGGKREMTISGRLLTCARRSSQKSARQRQCTWQGDGCTSLLRLTVVAGGIYLYGRREWLRQRHARPEATEASSCPLTTIIPLPMPVKKIKKIIQ